MCLLCAFFFLHVVCYRKSLHHVTPKWVVLQWFALFFWHATFRPTCTKVFSLNFRLMFWLFLDIAVDLPSCSILQADKDLCKVNHQSWMHSNECRAVHLPFFSTDSDIYNRKIISTNQYRWDQYTVLELQVYLSRVLHLFKTSFIDGYIDGPPVNNKVKLQRNRWSTCNRCTCRLQDWYTSHEYGTNCQYHTNYCFKILCTTVADLGAGVKGPWPPPLAGYCPTSDSIHTTFPRGAMYLLAHL